MLTATASVSPAVQCAAFTVEQCVSILDKVKVKVIIKKKDKLFWSSIGKAKNANSGSANFLRQ